MAKSKWKESFIQKGYELALEGMIDIQIAKKLGISHETYYQYQKEHPEFLEAIKIGKYESDQEVVDSMRKRAVGFTYEETTSEIKIGKGNEEDPGQGEITAIKKTTKYCPPDTGAGAFWLKNRQPELWRDSKHIEGNIGGGVHLIADKSTKEDLDGITEFGTRRPGGSDDSIQEESESS